MGGMGSDIAVENADIIIMNDDPAKVYDSIDIASKARNTSLFNIFFALAIKLAVYILALFFRDASWIIPIAASITLWTLLLAVFLQMLVLGDNIWIIFLVGVPVQAIVIITYWINS